MGVDLATETVKRRQHVANVPVFDRVEVGLERDESRVQVTLYPSLRREWVIPLHPLIGTRMPTTNHLVPLSRQVPQHPLVGTNCLGVHRASL